MAAGYNAAARATPLGGYSISLSWKDQAGKTGYSQNYFSRNEAQLVNVMGQATKWIAAAEAKDQAGQPDALRTSAYGRRRVA